MTDSIGHASFLVSSLFTFLVWFFLSCSALQIFQQESHPSVYKSGLNSSKEGLSLFGKHFAFFLLLCSFIISISFFLMFAQKKVLVWQWKVVIVKRENVVIIMNRCYALMMMMWGAMPMTSVIHNWDKNDLEKIICQAF